MRVCRYFAFYFLRPTRFAAWAAEASSVPSYRSHASSSGSGFSSSGAESVPDRYADDVFWQSGGVRVRAEMLNSNGGMEVYEQFMIGERQAQRAFIWYELKLENIFFVHLGTSAPMVQSALAKDVTYYSDRELRQIASSFGFRSTEEVKNLSELRDVPIGHLRDVAWNLDAARLFIQKFDSTIWYNDMLGASSYATESHAYDDPRYRNNDAVVNYRANARTVINECLDILDSSGSRSHSMGVQTSRLAARLSDVAQANRARKLQRHPSRRNVLLQNGLQSRRSHTFDIDVNVDCFIGKYSPDEVYQVIAMEIDLHIERTYDSPSSIAEATMVLEQKARQETAKARKYATFNNPRMRRIAPVKLSTDAPMSYNINKVITRAILRRNEFHKMTEPFVVQDGHVPTYRVHFTDPENRYSAFGTAIASKPKRWYQAIWTRLLEPIFKVVVLKEMQNTVWRDIVLIDSDPSDNPNCRGYVSLKQHMIVYCNGIDDNHREVAQMIGHEYEHTVDFTTDCRTSNRYRLMENERDPRTLSQETLQIKIREATAAMPGVHDTKSTAAQRRLIALQTEQTARALAETSSSYNADNCFGLPSMYARTSVVEAVAEQRYAMRNTAIRTALLRRMSLHTTPGPRQDDATRQKTFYDIARQEMKDVAPQLWKEWGQYYDGRDVHEWGLAPGAVQRTDKLYQIMALDNTIATTIASERLATKLLQQGYDVSITVYNSALGRQMCKLQSNVEDPPPGRQYPAFELRIVGGRTMTGKDIAHRVLQNLRDYQPTGRKRFRPLSLDDLHVEAVTIVRPPQHAMRFSGETDQALQTAFMKEIQSVSLQVSMDISVYSGHIDVAHDGTIVSVSPQTASDAESIWVHESNLYRSTIFDGWSIDGVDVWEPIDQEVQMVCVRLT